MTKYLTYSPGRRKPWTEHNCFPAKAIKIWQEGQTQWYARAIFMVYRISEDREQITLIPPEEWSDADTRL